MYGALTLQVQVYCYGLEDVASRAGSAPSLAYSNIAYFLISIELLQVAVNRNLGYK
jgi:hypothetical protein